VTGGDLRVIGMDARREERRIKQRIGVVTQENDLDPDLTVVQNLAVYASFFGLSRRKAEAKARELLAFVQLEEKAGSYVGDLSGGMKRRLTIARALVNDPELLILDEPTTALDPQARLLVWQRLSDLKARGVTLLLTTHYMEEAARLCDRLVIMHEGRILTEGSPRQLIAGHVAEYVVELPRGGSYNDAILKALGDRIRFCVESADGTLVYSKDGPGVRRVLLELGVPEDGARTREATLEDVFLHLTGRELEE
jgi:lipooligosaccharide transport system ATP-binding protein